MVKKIKDVFEVDVNQEVKQVIDVEQPEESEVQKEINNYIVTRQLAKHFGTLFDALEEELEETGVWLSGFYGSGKSYFAKVFGYLLRNPSIKGTSVHERFSQRLEGLDEKVWLRQSLGMVRNKDFEVVMLDLTKQGKMAQGLPWTLFENLLDELGFLDSKYGLIEYDLFLNNDYDKFLNAVERETGESWDDLKLSLGRSYSAMREALQSEFPDSYGSDVDQLYDDVEGKMENFGAADLKRELQRFFDKCPEKQLYFIVDEVSQAVTDKLIDLSDLEGVQESLTAVGASKVWLMATAQEKLTDVLSRDSISKNELSKITDRFKTNLHISGEEVDKVVKERLLKKNDRGKQALVSFYEEHSGEISELTNLQKCEIPSTTTDSKEDFVSNYPFHPYQMQLLKDFLYKVHQQVTGSQTPRGLIIVLHRVLKQIADEELYQLATAYQLAEHGEKFPNTAIKQRFNQAEGVLDSNVANGRHIMEAVHFLTETGKVTPEVEDIAKSCLSETGKYYDVKSDYSKSIEELEKHNLLIKKEGYSIATELEEQLISEMGQEDVGHENRKRILADQVNETGLFAGFQSVKVEGQHYKVKAIDSSGNLLAGKSESKLRLKILNIYEIGSMDYQEAIEDTKLKEEANENTLTIIPRVKDFHKIDSLIQKIYRYEIIENRYGNDSDKEKREIVEDMQDDRRNKEEVLRQKLKKAYQNGVLIRDFEEYQLSEANFGIIKDQMEELAKNLYTKRLSNHLDEKVAPKILKQENPERLGDHFEAEEFKFFDSGGTFIGNGLLVVDEITRRTSDIAVDGKTLEDEFSAPPYGWELGDIMVTLAALLRAGQLKVKYKGEEILDYRKSSVHSVFNKSRSFRKAQFKVTSVKLSPNKKRQLVDSIKEINGKKYSDSDLDHNSADIHVVRQIPQIAGGYLEEARSLERTLGDFADEVSELSSIKNQLNTYHNRTVNEDTYKQVANEFLEDAEQISTYIDLLRELQNFQENKLGKLRRYRSFVKDLESQISKVEDQKLQGSLQKNIEDFSRLNDDPVNNFPELQESFQEAKDFYHEAMTSSHQAMTKEHGALVNNLEEVLSEAKKAGENVNRELIDDLQSQISEARSYVCDKLSITDSVKCDNCQNDLKTAVLATDNINNLENKLFGFRERIEVPKDNGNGEKEVETHSVTISSREMTVSEFRDFLSTQLERVKSMDPNDEIEIDLNV